MIGNAVGDAENNVCLMNDSLLEVSGALDEAAALGVNRGSGAQIDVFTSGLSIGGSADNFSSDNDGYAVRINDDGEATLHYVYTAEWSWQDDYSAATATLTRAADGVSQSFPAVITSEEVSPAGCEQDRTVRYIATVTYDGLTYTDATDEVAVPGTATGHTYGEPVWTWSKSYHSATATFTCEAGDDEQTVTAKVTEVPTPDATCTEDGVMVHTAAVEFNGRTYTAVKNVLIPATGHAYGEPVWTWTEDHSTATAAFACEKGEDARTVTGNATQVEVSAATATEDQVVKYAVSVEFNGVTYTVESENVTVPGTATGTPDQPDQPDQPDTPDTPDTPSQGDNVCQWDNVDHGTSFRGRLVKFFHSILYFFAHLFGRK